MPRPLPNLAALRAFEAAGRHLSFSRAADELCVTQGAVSRHVQTLEQDLGLPLFERTRPLTLTPHGAAYHTAIRQAFAGMIAATRTARAEAEAAAPRRKIRVTLLASFAAHWLMPRLPAFEAAHPEIELVLEPSVRWVDPMAGQIDLALRYGKGGYDGLAECFLPEALVPVIAPSYYPAPTLETLLKHRLLHPSHTWEWRDWLAAQGIALESIPQQQALADYNITLQAARDGLGVAIGRLNLVAPLIARGDLIALPLPCLVGVFGHWSIIDPARVDDPALLAVRIWLRQTVNMNQTHTPSAGT
jgi:LysR family glycine cleavage system transcriptional activator